MMESRGEGEGAITRGTMGMPRPIRGKSGCQSCSHCLNLSSPGTMAESRAGLKSGSGR